MFKKTIILILAISFLSISAIVQASSADPSELYPHMSFEELENYEYVIDEYGPNYIVVIVDGKIYYVET